MSISDGRLNRFDDWLSAEYARRGDFTLLVVLASVEGMAIDLLSSTFMHVIGDEARWSDMRDLFAQSGARWNAAAFFPAFGEVGRPLPNDLARVQLRDLEERLHADRRILNEGHFFDRKGRRLKVEEADA